MAIAWAQLAAEKRALLSRKAETVEDRLRRGQQLSAQAAALRRAIHRDGAGPR